MQAARFYLGFRFSALARLCFIGLIAAGPLSGATFIWTGSVSTDWFNTNNWSPAGLPASTDTVTFTSGTINLTAPVAFSGQFNWSGGTLAGNPFTLAASGTMNLSGGNGKLLWTTLTNAGTVIWSGGNLEVDYSSAQSEYGLIRNLAGALWDIQGGQTLYNNYPNGAFFQNAGTVRKSVNAITTTISIPFLNSGTVTNGVGALALAKGGTIEGAFSAASGATINFNAGVFTYNTPPSITGAGTVEITGGSLTLPTNVIPNLQLLGGTITLGPGFQGGVITNLTLLGGTLPGNNLVSGSFYTAASLTGSLTLLSGAAVNWAGGSMQGPVNIPAGASLIISSNTQKYLWGALSNAGTVTCTATGNLEVDYASANNEFGLIQNLAGGLWDMQNNQNLYNGYPNGAYFQNSGTVQKSVTPGTTTISIPFNNSGTVTNLTGIIIFSGGGILGGSLSVSAGTTLNFSAGAWSYAVPPIVTGAGLVEITGGSLTLANNVIPNLQLLGGTITLGPAFQGGVITNLTLLGGTLPGNNAVSGTLYTTATLPGSLTVLNGAAVNWAGGSIQGPVNIAPGALLTLSSNNTKYLWGALTNAGTVTWTGGGNLEVDYASPNNQFGFIQNLPGALWDIQNSARLYNSAPNGAYFQNAGMVRKSADAGTTTISIPFYNSGSVTGLQGTLLFNGGGLLESTFTAASGATINFNAGAFTYNTPPMITGPGTVEITGGSLTLANNIIPNLQVLGGTISLGPGFQGGVITNLTALGGTLTGNNTVSGAFTTGANLPGSMTLLSGAAVNWSGGSIQGPVNIASGASLTLSSGPTKVLWGALTNAGTVTWTGSGNLEVDYSSANNQFGFIQNLPGGLWDIQNSAQIYNGSAANGAYFQNAGAVQKSSDTGTTTIAIPFYNSGSVKGLQGMLQFNGGGLIESAFTAASGATVNFHAGAFTYNTPPSITGAGTVEITGGSLTLANNVIPNLQLAGGTISLGSGFQGGVITNLTLLGGTLPGNNVVNGALYTAANLSGSLAVLGGSSVNWAGGSIQGPVNIASGASLTISSNTTKFLWGALTNAGTVTWTGGGNLEVDYASANNQFGSIQNLPGALWDIQNDQSLFNSSPNGAYFQNAGTLQKSVGANVTTISIPFTNAGTTKALQAALALNGGVSLAGGTLVNGIGSATTYGQFRIAGNATLTGALNVTWLGGFVGALSNSFSLVTYGSRTGTFSPFTLPSSTVWQTNYGATALTLSVAEIDELVIMSSPFTTNAGAVLAPLVVQVVDSVTTNAVPTNGLPVTVAIASGSGVVSGTVTRTTDATGKVTFNDLSINLVGNKTLVVSAPGMTPATTGFFNITPSVPAQLAIATPPAGRQQDGTVFQPFPVLQVNDAFGNLVPNATSTITAHVTASATGILAGSTTTNANGSTGSGPFTNLTYSLGNPLASETITLYFTSPGLASVTNSPVLVNFIFGLITLQSGNSVVRINPTDDQGVFSWKVDGVERLYQQWFWLRQGASGLQSSLDTLSAPLGVALSSSNATINYVAPPLNVNLGFVLHGGAPASNASDLAETLAVQNTTNSALTLHLFQYVDFDLAGLSGADTISFPTTNSVVQQGGNVTMTESVQSPPPSFWEASFYALTLDKIMGGSPATLSDTIMPASAGDQTYAYQWDVTLGPGQTVTINSTQSIRPIAGPDFPPGIALTISAAGTKVNVYWPVAGAARFQLQSASSLEGTGGWSDVTNPPAVIGPNYQVTLPQAAGVQFYRLRY
ncbi:MAG TPA: hypothetical protein VNZ64_02815 [Candidatus Acidoferrum sp.]|jgi:hypothetical protein|nr:hypothetical protein [Candidatus Acidoferrum sp.]